MHFGATLRLLRVDRGWTLRELADRIGVSSAYLSRVENGHDAPPTPDRLAAIARAFGLPAMTLLELADRIGAVAFAYLDRVGGARDLMMEIIHRDLGPMEIAKLRAFLEREMSRTSAPPPGGAELRSMLDPGRVIVALSCDELEDAIDLAAPKLAEVTGASARAIADAIVTREGVCSSALGGGLAVPHAIVAGVEPSAVVVTLRRPLPIAAPDDAPVRACIVHVHPGGVAHARALAEMAHAAAPAIVERICAERSPSRIVAALNEASATHARVDK